MLQKAGKKTQFVSGLRVTDAESVELAEMVLVGKNQHRPGSTPLIF